MKNNTRNNKNNKIKAVRLTDQKKANLICTINNHYQYSDKSFKGLAYESNVSKSLFTNIIEEAYLFFLNTHTQTLWNRYDIIDREAYPYISTFNNKQLGYIKYNIRYMPRTNKVKKNFILRTIHKHLKKGVRSNITTYQSLAYLCECDREFLSRLIKEFDNCIRSSNNKRLREFGIKCGLNDHTEPNGIVQTIQEIGLDYFGYKPQKIDNLLQDSFDYNVNRLSKKEQEMIFDLSNI